MRLGKESAQYSPGEILTCEYEVKLRDDDPSENNQITAIETSVLWITEGKGDTDMGVHFFERREKKNVLPELLKHTHKLSTMLPQSPLSYEGWIVKINWVVRVRIFMRDGSEKTQDELFRLGHTSMLTKPPLGLVSGEEEEEES